MHEYVHDYFQFGRPELLNKVIRKAFTVRNKFKHKELYTSVDQMLYLTPLQKARRALRLALKEASQDVYPRSLPKSFSSLLKYEDTAVDLCEDETSEIDWQITDDNVPENYLNKTGYTNANKPGDNSYSGNLSQDPLINFDADKYHQSTDNFADQFLNMPVLDPETVENSSVELLAEFNIDNEIDEGIARKITENRATIHNSLNCVLPSVSNDKNDDVGISQKSNELDHYHGEWEKMFDDMTNKAPSQDCVSDLKKLYSQISITIDLLNN